MVVYKILSSLYRKDRYKIMADVVMTVLDENVFEHEYDKYRGAKTSGLEACGACLMFAQFMQEHGYDWVDADEVWNNTSGLRDGNRLDFMDNYVVETDDGDEVEFTFMYIVNGTVWAVLYDPEEDSYVGDIEIYA